MDMVQAPGPYWGLVAGVCVTVKVNDRRQQMFTEICPHGLSSLFLLHMYKRM